MDLSTSFDTVWSQYQNHTLDEKGFVAKVKEQGGFPKLKDWAEKKILEGSAQSTFNPSALKKLADTLSPVDSDASDKIDSVFKHVHSLSLLLVGINGALAKEQILNEFNDAPADQRANIALDTMSILTNDSVDTERRELMRELSKLDPTQRASIVACVKKMRALDPNQDIRNAVQQVASLPNANRVELTDKLVALIDKTPEKFRRLVQLSLMGVAPSDWNEHQEIIEKLGPLLYTTQDLGHDTIPMDDEQDYVFTHFMPILESPPEERLEQYYKLLGELKRLG